MNPLKHFIKTDKHSKDMALNPPYDPWKGVEGMEGKQTVTEVQESRKRGPNNERYVHVRIDRPGYPTQSILVERKEGGRHAWHDGRKK